MAECSSVGTLTNPASRARSSLLCYKNGNECFDPSADAPGADCCVTQVCFLLLGIARVVVNSNNDTGKGPERKRRATSGSKTRRRYQEIRCKRSEASGVARGKSNP